MQRNRVFQVLHFLREIVRQPREPSHRHAHRQPMLPGFQLPEEEIGRAGVLLRRVACRTRLSDGTMQLWMARRKQIGAGEASSGLRFDQLRPAGTQ